ncbi:MAG: glutaredoxin family protein [Gammaproteobacteria bacterium]|nr:glutaredoxin family protein [Gammaproteobacteria bacterium]
MSHAERAAAPPRLTLITRAECGLCETMHAEIEQLRRTHPLPQLEVHDVDADPELKRRFDLEVPVLLLDGTLVCQQELDAAELLRLLRR